MGNVTSRQDEAAALFLRDQHRFYISGLVVSNARNRTLLRVSPNDFPASRYAARKDLGDDSPVDYVQDPESTLTGGPPAFLLRLPSDDELTFTFNCSIRQSSTVTPPEGPHGATAGGAAAVTSITGLTFVFGSNAKEIDQLVTREFHADPNIHKNPNVAVVGDYSTAGSPSAQFSYSWKWKPPKATEDVGGGWRTTCSFVEYDQRAHKLNTLALFSFWIQNTARQHYSPQQRSPRLDTISPQRLRVPSSQSIESRMSAVSDSDGETPGHMGAPQTPSIEPIPEYRLGLVDSAASPVGPSEKLDFGNVGRPAEDMSATEDGPLFRATMKSLESKTGTLRTRMKRVLRTAETAESAQKEYNEAIYQFMEALREAADSNSSAIRPALEHYFEKIAKEILAYEKQNAQDLRKLVIEPISKLYNVDIKQAESKRRDFEEESKDYYAYVGKYLGQRTDSLKERKRVESDSKYQSKRRTFELKRFDYSSFMHDLHGGRKDQEILSQLTRYASAQAHGYLKTAKKVEEMVPTLEALCQEVSQADKEFQFQRTEREEKRRALEKNPRASVIDPEGAAQLKSTFASSTSSRGDVAAMYGSSPPQSTLQHTYSMNASVLSAPPPEITALPTRNVSNKFKGIRDLEDCNATDAALSNPGQIRKEGLLWSLSRPGAHIDPKGLKTAGWHKFWIVLDQGKLSEYVNWKDKLDLHMEPIDLRVASVREARNAERRFCFEVITPQYTRVYQATSEDDMRTWIAAINNALQSAFEAKNPSSASVSTNSSTSARKDIAAVLTGKSSSVGHKAHGMHASKLPHRHATTGDKPGFMRLDSDIGSSEVFLRIRDADVGNKCCADCGSEAKVDWVSINLGIVLCIECSGIHRSLGTHISKIRSLTLDTAVFTPDIIELLLLVGNRVSNMIWEARLDRSLKPTAYSTREQRLHFITAKYAERAFVEPDPSHPPDENLLTGIKRDSIQSVLHALALRANPNALDRSRGTHAVYLALAAADPALPGSTTTASSFPSTLSPHHPLNSSPSHSPTTPERPQTPVRKPFPVAELLLQNGADIPSIPSPFPLSVAARHYLDAKSELRNGRLTPAGLGTSPVYHHSMDASPGGRAGGAGGGAAGGEAGAGAAGVPPVPPPKEPVNGPSERGGSSNSNSSIRAVSGLGVSGLSSHMGSLMGGSSSSSSSGTAKAAQDKEDREQAVSSSSSSSAALDRRASNAAPSSSSSASGPRRPGGWSNSGFVGGVKALGDVGRRS